MNRALTFLLAALLAGGLYYYFFYPPNIYQRRAEKALAQFDAVMVPQAKAQVSAQLQSFLSDDAAIHLEVSFFTPLQGAGSPILQDFDKTTFVTFIDNVLYPLSDYSFSSIIRDFTLSPDHKTAAIAFLSREWADGVSLYGGTSVNVRYSSDTSCTGQVKFDNDRVLLQKADCKMELRTVPKPGEAAKFNNMQTMQDLINRN